MAKHKKKFVGNSHEHFVGLALKWLKYKHFFLKDSGITDLEIKWASEIEKHFEIKESNIWKLSFCIYGAKASG